LLHSLAAACCFKGLLSLNKVFVRAFAALLLGDSQLLV
jgi:hypothetical protein